MRTDLVTTPRPVPSKTAPALAALLVLGLALPIFLVAGWDVRGWALGALLWAGTRGISMLLTHMRKGASTTTASGLQAFELGFKALAVLVVLVALAGTEPQLALSATLVFALAYTIELALSLTTYFGGTR
jgi:hypothetical protein